MATKSPTIASMSERRLDFNGEVWRTGRRSLQIMPVRQRKKAAKPNPPTEHPKPYQSPLWDHLDTIAKLRRRRQPWESIAEHLNNAHGLNVSYKTVQRFFKRASDPANPRKLKALPLGFDPSVAVTVQEPIQRSSGDRLRAEAALIRKQTEEKESKWKFGSPYEETTTAQS
jgi:hypothetical protein